MNTARTAVPQVLVARLASLAMASPASAAAPYRKATGPADLASAKTLRALNATEYGFGHPRPTGSATQRKLVDWLERRLDRVPGVRLSSLRYRIRRWDATSGSVRMHVGGRERRAGAMTCKPAL